MSIKRTYIQKHKSDYPVQHTIYIIETERKILFCHRNKVQSLCYPFNQFSLKKCQKGNTLSHSYLLKNILKLKWETEKQNAVFS